MKLSSSVRLFLAFVLHRPRIEREMEEELRSHLQSRADDLERQGGGLLAAMRRDDLDQALPSDAGVRFANIQSGIRSLE